MGIPPGVSQVGVGTSGRGQQEHRAVIWVGAIRRIGLGRLIGRPPVGESHGELYQRDASFLKYALCALV